jgi:hypothetical protein
VDACSRSGPVVLGYTCQTAEYIIRATALQYSQAPKNPNTRTTGVPDSKVAFKVEEILKGDSLFSPIELNGYLTDDDDFNTLPVPYRFARPGAHKGSCYANQYKRGAQYLLFLKKATHVKSVRATTALTVNIDALAPVNEQLHSPHDPWMYYIKGVIEGLKVANTTNKVAK